MIGLQRGTVKLENYNPAWAGEFGQEKRRLEKVFGESASVIEHVGSTAVPGLPAKPIIDIAVALNNRGLRKRWRQGLAELGYFEKPDDPKADIRLFFIKGPEECRTHYLKIAPVGSGYIEEMVRFRDCLREHPELRAKYAELKKELTKEFSRQRAYYTERKNEFIKGVLVGRSSDNI